MAGSDTHLLALSFARWRNKLPAEAICVTSPGTPRFIALPLGLSRWLRRTASSRCRIAFARGDEWWAYDFVDVTGKRGTSDKGATLRYFVIASSDRHDPEWGADYEFDAHTRSWKLSADAPDFTYRRLASLQMKA